jgi:hypothetical protein
MTKIKAYHGLNVVYAALSLNSLNRGHARNTPVVVPTNLLASTWFYYSFSFGWSHEARSRIRQRALVSAMPEHTVRAMPVARPVAASKKHEKMRLV